MDCRFDKLETTHLSKLCFEWLKWISSTQQKHLMLKT